MVTQVLARRSLAVLLLLALASVAGAAWARLPGTQEATRHELTLKAKKYQFSQARIEVAQGDVIKITLVAEDIPHSFVIDAPYRIAKRVTPGKPVTFEFRADQVGTFPFYCNLTADAGCKDMRGQLVVVVR